MSFPLSLDQQQYEALVAFARRGTLTAGGQVREHEAHALEAFLVDLERKNGIERNAIWLQWQEQDVPLPPNTNFPEKWPPEYRAYIALVGRAVARVDVDAVLKSKARKPTSVLVTKDPAAKVGWTELDVFFR